MDALPVGALQLHWREGPVEEFRLRSPLYCPFLLPILVDGTWSYSSQPSCRLPSGELRGISACEFERFCVAGRYYDCPGYRFWRQSAPLLA